MEQNWIVLINFSVPFLLPFVDFFLKLILFYYSNSVKLTWKWQFLESGICGFQCLFEELSSLYYLMLLNWNYCCYFYCFGANVDVVDEEYLRVWRGFVLLFSSTWILGIYYVCSTFWCFLVFIVFLWSLIYCLFCSLLVWRSFSFDGLYCAWI